MTQRWPDTLWIVRHGESAGNVARDAAYAAGLPMIDIAERDVDVPLSPTGETQAAALGRLVRAHAGGRAAIGGARVTVPEAGRVLARRMGTIGFLARELLEEVPRLMNRQRQVVIAKADCA